MRIRPPATHVRLFVPITIHDAFSHKFERFKTHSSFVPNPRGFLHFAVGPVEVSERTVLAMVGFGAHQVAAASVQPAPRTA